MYCKNCGKELPDDARFCPECGEQIADGDIEQKKEVYEKEPQFEPDHSNTQMRMLKSGIFILAGVLIIVVIACFAYISQKGREAEMRAVQEEKERAVHEGQPYRRTTNNFYHQAHLPVREQAEATGHAVRAVYLYSGMADVARLCRDEAMEAACDRLWDNVTREKMYVTGGIGATHLGEAFSFNYDLPNDTAYLRGHRPGVLDQKDAAAKALREIWGRHGVGPV